MKQIEKTLSNGLRVFVCEDHFSPVVSIQMWVNVGSADETAKQAGFAHVLEHMLFKGTPSRPVGSIASEIEGAGGDINAFTGHDQTCYYINMASRYFDTGIKVLADAICNSSLDRKELDKETKVILEEMSKGNDSPMHKLSEGAFAKVFQKHPFGRPIIGNKKTLKNLSRKKLQDFYRRHYRPSNMFLVIAGDIDSKKAVRLSERLFSGMKKAGYRKPKRQQEPIQKSARSLLLFTQTNEVIYNIHLRTPGIFHKDAPALDALAMILGSGDSSRLHQKLWEENSAAYSTWASAYLPKDAGVLNIGMITEPKLLAKSMKLLWKEIFAFLHTPPLTLELEKIKRLIEGEMIYQIETYDGRARKSGYSLCTSGELDLEEKYLARIKSLTVNDLILAARKYFVPENLTLTMMGSNELKGKIMTDDLKESMKKAYFASKKSSPNAKKESITEESDYKITSIYSKKKKIQKITLKNGIRLILAQNPNAPVFAFRSVMLGGRIFEPKPGLSNFTALLLNKGTKDLNAAQFAQTIDSMAASVHGFSGLNTLGISGGFMSRDFNKGIELLCRSLTKPAFDEYQIEQTRQELKFAFIRREEKPAKKVFDLFTETLFGPHPYSIPALGTIKSIETIGRKDISKYWKRVLSPDRLVICLSGDISPKDAADQFEKHLGKLTPQKLYKAPTSVLIPEKSKLSKIQMSKEQAHIILGFLGVGNNHIDRHALQVLIAAISGQGGRLFIELRDKMHLAYSVSGFNVFGINTGFIGFYLGTRQANVNIAVNALKTLVQNIKEKGLTTSELKRAKRYLIGSFEIELASNANMAAQISLSEAYGLGHLSHEKYSERIKKVTLAKVQDAAMKYLDLDKHVLAMVAAK